MSEGQKRRVGQGMKPRGETATVPEQVPTTEGQPESIIGPILERQQVEQGGEHLETDSVQNLDSAENPSVAPERTIMDEVVDAEFEDPGVDNPKEAEPVSGSTVVTLHPEGGLIDGIHSDTGYGVKTWTNEATGHRQARIYALGEQANGSYKIVATIPEGYYNAVKDWADSAGLSVEEWIDQCLSQYLETWGQPAQGR